MSNITFSSFTEERAAANKGGLVSENFKDQTAELTLNEPWKSKDGRVRTGKDGNGSLGVKTSLGWLNASALLSFLSTIDESEVYAALIMKHPAVAAVPAKAAAQGRAAVAAVAAVDESFELVCDGETLIAVTFDADGKITNVALA